MGVPFFAKYNLKIEFMRIYSENQNSQFAIVLASNGASQPAVNRPTLENLISKCDPQAPMPSQDPVWAMSRFVGNELL
jgi:hypothetical protein